MESPQSQSGLSRYARLLPAKLLRAHLIMGAIQLTLGCLLIFLNIYGLLAWDRAVNTHIGSGFWTSVFLVPAGATGLAAGLGRKRTHCCLISCLVLSILTAAVSLIAIIVGSVEAARPSPHAYYKQFTIGDVLWFIAFLLGLVVAIVQAVFACRASCCCVADAASDQLPPDYEAGAGVKSPYEAQPHDKLPPSQL